MKLLKKYLFYDYNSKVREKKNIYSKNERLKELKARENAMNLQ